MAPRGRERDIVPYRIHGLWPALRLRPRLALAGASLLARPFFDVALALRLEHVARVQQLDVLLAHNYEGLAVALAVRARTGIPVVYHAHNVAEDELPWLGGASLGAGLGRLGRLLDHQLPRRADAVVALSDDVAAHLVARGVAPERMHVIAPGLDPRPFVGWRRRRRKLRVVFAGNLDAYQNIAVLLEAWRQVAAVLPTAELRIVIHTGEERRGAMLAGRSGMRVVVARSLQDVAREIGAAAVGVSPRQSWSGYPIKIVKYMAAALPTVAMPRAAKGVVAGRTGWVAGDESAAALGAVLREALLSPAECRRRGEAAAWRLDRDHSWRQQSSQLLGVVESVVAGEPGRGRLPAAVGA